MRVTGLVTGALVADLRRLSGEYTSTRCDLREAWLSTEGANALRAWHRAAQDTVELLLPDTIAAPDVALDGAERTSPVDLPALLAHEVRGPLSVAHLRLQTQAARLAAQGLPSEEAACRSVIAGIEAVSRLFDTYLTASRPWAMHPLDLRAVSLAAADDARALAGRGSIDVEAEAGGAPLWVSGERQALHQLFWNLMRNGLEAAPEQPEVRVEFPSAAEGRHVAVVISDRGPGFPHEVLAAPFHARRSEKAGGMGIGLILCKWIIDRHRGHMHLSNVPGGAEVRLLLPRVGGP